MTETHAYSQSAGSERRRDSTGTGGDTAGGVSCHGAGPDGGIDSTDLNAVWYLSATGAHALFPPSHRAAAHSQPLSKVGLAETCQDPVVGQRARGTHQILRCAAHSCG